MTRTASCQCRGFRVVVEAEPDTVGICHCQICQRRTGVPLTCNAYFPKRRFSLRASTESIPGSVQTDANCTIISARPAARRSAGLSICVQITLVSRLGVSTTGISRLPWRRSGRRRCALGQCCQQAFSISRALDRFRARVKRNLATSAGGPARAAQRRVAFLSMDWNTGSSSPGELLMTCNTSEVAVCCSSASARCFCASASSRVRWSSCFWRSAAVGPRCRATGSAFRPLSFVVSRPRFFIAAPPVAARAPRAATLLPRHRGA